MKDDVKFYIKFIKTVEEFPCLYDYNHDDYNSKTAVKEAWQNVGSIFGETGLTCKRKWRIIRSSYIRWKTLKQTAGPKHAPRKEYYLAPYLRFLDPFTRASSGQNEEEPIEFCSYENLDCNVNSLTEQIDETNVHSLLEQNQNEFTVKRRVSTESEGYVELTPLAKKKKDKQERDPTELYLLSLAPHLKTMTERQILSFQRGVADLIEKIKYPDTNTVVNE